MSIALADAPPGGCVSQEDDIAELPYLWSDLLARRNALGLQTEELSPVLGLDNHTYRQRESGALSVGRYLLLELILMQRFVAQVEQELLASVSAEGVTIFQAIDEQSAFEIAYPQARTRRDQTAYPLLLQHVALGRAVAQLTRQGRDVEVHRAGRRADLSVRRLACALLKDETARLLGIAPRKYARFESSATAPPEGLVAELQAVDDFIVTSAAQLDVIDEDGVQIVMMIDENEFERTYPQARTRRDAVVYPRRVHRVAAGRRAGELDARGAAVRIAIED